MFTKYKVSLYTYPEKKQFYLITKRLLNRSPIRFRDNELKNDQKRKGKITIIKRKLNNDEGNNILEWKSAASVIKRQNWENTFLFGPIQASKTKIHGLQNIFETSNIIQQETQIPIIEPTYQAQNTEEESTQIYSSAQTVDLNSILTFPLENKLNHPTDKINELNSLRKHLESCSKGSVPSVSSILQKTMPKERVKILELWKENMIKKLGEEGFQRYHKALLDNGSALHNNISSFLSSVPESELEIKKENIGHWSSLKDILPTIKDVKLLEEFVTHPFLCYRGIVDCFAKYRDNLVVIDWKTSKKAKTHIKDVYDNPLQVAAYVGALNFDPRFQYLARKGLIVVAYESGMPATIHFIDEVTMKHYWNEWLKRVKEFWKMKILETENL